MTTMGEMRCRHCDRNAHEIGGYLGRVNKGETPSIWECQPNCQADLPQDTKLLLAVDGESP